MDEQKPTFDQLREDFPAYAEYVHIVTKDGKTVPLKLTRLQRKLWDWIQQNIKDDGKPYCTILKRWRLR